MKKISYLFLIISTLLLLSSCEKKTVTVKGPDEILTEGKIIEYSYSLEQVEDKLGEGEPDEDHTSDRFDSYKFSDDLIILFNKEDKLRMIDIEDDDIKTYKNICVGDDIDKVVDNFKYEIDAKSCYSVYFDGDKEFDAMDKNKRLTSDWITITYYMDEDDEIERILIMDNDYALLMK